MSERPLSSLSYEELMKICEIAEEAARKYITSKVPKEHISDLSISIELESEETLSINVDVEVRLSSLYKDINVKEIAESSVKAAFDAVEKHLNKIRLKRY
ncbi:MAG: DUF3194 domain-containing protein [Candidatus Bathyarchaeia archaeon]|nr:DUF3194 domain-containing protein [Candidatus Bathyarchaeota archaeon]